MAFNNVGNLTGLAPGARTTWTYDFRGQNLGTQFASADVKTPNSTPHLAYDQTKRIEPDGRVVYSVTIQNLGTQWAWHNLQGGGLG